MNFVIAVTILFISTGICFGENVFLPDHEYIQYDGVLDSKDTVLGRELFRFKPSYIEAGKLDHSDQSKEAEWAQAPARSLSGMVIRMKTKSPKVSFRFSKSLKSSNQYSLFQLFRNGIDQGWVEKEEDTEVIISKTVFSADPAEPAIWECVLPALVSYYFKEIILEENYELEPLEIKTKPINVAIGNSITMGVGQDQGKTASTYPYQLSQALGYELYNMGIGGSSINSDVVENLSSLNPELITVLWGYNNIIYNPQDMAVGMTKYEELLKSLVVNFPNAKIVMIGQTFTKKESGIWNSDNTMSKLREEQLQIFEDLQKTHLNIFYLEGLDFTGENSLKDDVHLNNEGAKELAEALIQWIPQFELKETVALDFEYEDNETTKFILDNYNLTIMAQIDFHQVNAYSLSGETVFESNFNPIKQRSIALDHLKPGIYYLTMSSNSGINSHKKIVVNNDGILHN